MKKCLGMALLLLAGCASTPTPTDELNQLMDATWQQQLEAYPSLAHRYGDADAAGRLADTSPQFLASQHQAYLDLLARANALQSDELSAEQQVDLAILLGILNNQVDSYRFKEHLVPISSEGGFHAYIASFARNARLTDEQAIEHYLSRLQALPVYFDQQIAWMRQGMAEGITVPQVVLPGFEDSILAFIPDTPEQSLYYRPLDALGEAHADAKKQGLTLVQEQVIPAYQAFYDFFINEYQPAARQTIAASELPDGRDYYENRVRHFTTLGMTADEVHQLGLEEVARIRAEMEQVILELGFEGSFAEFLDFLRTDPRFYAQTPDELLRYAAFLSKQADAMLPRFFKTLPRTPYGIKEVPAEIAPKYTTGRYSGSSNDDQPGYYWVNTYALDKRPLYEMEALTLHEAVPGHHLQIALSQEQDVHLLRRNHYISAFGEGWGLYAEKLGLEGGFYQDPYSNFGRLTYEMWRACRLVVDTGMHAKGWSRDQALAFLADNTALSLHNVQTEIDRYISWPGQAVSYKVGELTLWRLRNKAEAELGDQFDVRAFHDQVLGGGSMPLAELERQLDAWIATQRQG
ncbi:DUF885 domain-containing protein [Ferrimonas balearica]|uniref:DUF885 domain-containing protein n=1 Tax=Ferrimonas balearica TaxID=44012 RepID=UPI001C99CCD4|nr:DUF885 domain-containing protein [Ferrimonas balearica]MBY5922764.1 DUF885 domain-containing protein [Ferrimonas balearica]MBY5995748.1 DUF885 domain-containing protein [Ferrimonas balearica]